MKKTAIILGTANYDGNTRKLISLIEQQMPVEVFLLKDFNISAFDYEHNNIDDDFIPLIERLLAFDHLVFASPVYWYTMSAQLKVFVDRLSDLLSVRKELGRQLRGKSGSVIATSASSEAPPSFSGMFDLIFNYLGMDNLGLLHCSCEQGYQPDDYKAQIDGYIKQLNR
jgi:multimeric flavodoxin WrbA